MSNNKWYGSVNNRVDEGKDIIRYKDLNGKISFGVKDYYYDDGRSYWK